MDIVSEVKEIVIAAAQDKSNKFSIDAWDNHIELVYIVGGKLAEKFQADKEIPRQTLEAEIVASADAMSHILHFPSILRLSLVSHNMPMNEAVIWSWNKIQRSWAKIMPEARELVRPQYEAIQTMLACPLGKGVQF